MLYRHLHLHNNLIKALEKLDRMDNEMYQGMGDSLEVSISNRAIDILINIFLLYFFDVCFQHRPKRAYLSCLFYQHYADNLLGIFGYQSRWTFEDRFQTQVK